MADQAEGEIVRDNVRAGHEDEGAREHEEDAVDDEPAAVAIVVRPEAHAENAERRFL